MILNFIRNRLCTVCAGSPKKAITYAWFNSIILIFITFIVSCIMASEVPQKALAFTGIWTAFLLVLFSIGRTLVMRRYQTPLALGFFLGAVVVIANQLLILTAIFGAENDMRSDDASGWFASFCFILFVIYVVFGLMLAVFRADLVQDNGNWLSENSGEQGSSSSSSTNSSVPAGSAGGAAKLPVPAAVE
jgi:hypothetical protein